MIKFIQRIVMAIGFVATAGTIGAVADYAVTVGAGTTIFAFTCFTTKVCPAHVTVDSAGTEISPATQATTASILTAVQSAIPVGSNLIGKVGIDQTTPGTTNAVAPINGQTGVAGGTGVVGATVQRVTLATDVALPAGELHVGEVGGNILPITNAMTTSNATVTTGKAIGGLQTLANAVRVSSSLGASGTSGIIQSVLLTFKDAIGTIPMDVYYFNASPTGSTCTDNTTFALVDADRDKTVFIAHVTDWTASNTAAIGQAGNMAIPFGLSSATSLFACVVTRASAAVTGTANASLITRVMRN